VASENIPANIFYCWKYSREYFQDTFDGAGVYPTLFPHRGMWPGSTTAPDPQTAERRRSWRYNLVVEMGVGARAAGDFV
jgi:hypothetical protein